MARAYSELGTYLYERGRIDEAIEACRRLTELTPASAVAYNLGAALQMKGDVAASADAYRRSLEPSRGAYSNLGSYHYYLGEYAVAADYYGKAAALAAQDQTMWGNLADAVWQIAERRPEALGYYRRAIGLAERELASGNQDALLLAQLAYYGAIAMTARGDAAEASRLAKLAVANGYPQSLLDTDPSLAVASGTDGESRPPRGTIASILQRSVQYDVPRTKKQARGKRAPRRHGC